MIQIILCEDEQDFLAKITGEVLDWKAMRGHQDVLVQSFASAEDLWEALERGLSCDLLAKIATPAPSARDLSTTLPAF